MRATPSRAADRAPEARLRTVPEHRAAALTLVRPLAAVTVPLDDADGYVLAADVAAPTELPRWDSSAMDGYAVRAADVASATPAAPVTLRVVAELPAGSGAQPHVSPGTAARIMTGAPMPPGADAIVPVEATDGGTTTVRIDAAPDLGTHIRRAGEDVATGEVVLTAGTVIGPAQVSAAASVGLGAVTVHRRPRVVVLSTGSELAEPGTELRHGQIPDSNSYMLAALVRAAGCEAVRLGAVPDDAATLRALLDEWDRVGGAVAPGDEPADASGAGGADAVTTGPIQAIVSSGGVSMGVYDVVKEVLAAQAAMEFVSVAMQPGKPQGLGRLAGGTPVFALPGNPVSAFVSFHVFVRPAMLRMRGLAQVEPRLDAVVVEDGWRTPRGREQYMPVTLVDAGDGLRARRAVPGGSGSHLVAGLARAHALAVVAADVDEVRPGEKVRVMRVDR